MDEQTTKMLVEIIAKQDVTLSLVAGIVAQLNKEPVEGILERAKEAEKSLRAAHLAYLTQAEQGKA